MNADFSEELKICQEIRGQNRQFPLQSHSKQGEEKPGQKCFLSASCFQASKKEPQNGRESIMLKLDELGTTNPSIPGAHSTRHFPFFSGVLNLCTAHFGAPMVSMDLQDSNHRSDSQFKSDTYRFLLASLGRYFLPFSRNRAVFQVYFDTRNPGHGCYRVSTCVSSKIRGSSPASSSRLGAFSSSHSKRSQYCNSSLMSIGEI